MVFLYLFHKKMFCFIKFILFIETTQHIIHQDKSNNKTISHLQSHSSQCVTKCLHQVAQ